MPPAGPLQARCLGLPFWAPLGALGVLTTLGETLCWSHVLLQSELLGWVEDSTWTTLQVVATAMGTGRVRFALCAPFALYMVAFHLPRMVKRIERPWMLGWTGSPLRQPDADTVAWVVPSLIAKPLAYAVFLYYTP